MAAGIGVMMLPVAPAIAALPTAKLPGEYSRTTGKVTAVGKVTYDQVSVRISGDAARIYIPQSLSPYSNRLVRVAWFYHGTGSDQTALDGGFKADAERVVDAGMIAICQNDGGTLYSNPTAQSLQHDGYHYMAGLFSIAGNVLRATSGGGALACETYGSKLIPNVIGLYMCNAVYNIRAIYDLGGSSAASIGAAFNNDTAAMDAANPARLPQAAWAKDQLRILVSQPDDSDTIVPPASNGLALYTLAGPVATEDSLRTHNLGHNTPTWEPADFATALTRWAPPLPVTATASPTPTATATPTPTPTPTATAPADKTAPTVSITSPANGATVKGVVVLTATAADNVGVTGVTFYSGNTALGIATLSKGVWTLSFNTASKATPNGSYPLTARATDAAGNIGTSATSTIRVAN